MSLDGFTAGQSITQENPMGLNGHLLHRWLFNDKQEEDEEVASDTFKNCGAVILGSNTYTSAIHGVWENRSPFPVPAFVLSSKKFKVEKGFTVVGDGVASALSQARSIAGGKDILIMGGANVAQQFLKAYLLDEIHIHIAPILLGSGTQLFTNGINGMMELTKIKVIETRAATHLFLKPRK